MGMDEGAWVEHYKGLVDAAIGTAGPEEWSGTWSRSTTTGSPTDGAKAACPDKRSGPTLVFGVVLNLTRTIVGSGVLCLPFALQEGGAGLGVLALVATACLSLTGFLATGHACHATGARSYREAWRLTVGTAPLLVDVMVFFECLITCVGYVILILDYLGKGLQGMANLPVTVGLRARLAGAITMSFLIPLCLRPRLDSLKFSSLLGNMAMLYTITYVILDSVVCDGRTGLLEDVILIGTDSDGVFRSMCVMTSAYIAHYSAPAFLDELSAHPKPWRGFHVAAVASFGISLFAYGLFAVAGYERFGSKVLGNILLNYDSSLYVFLAWMSMAATLTVSFPLIFKPARDTLAEVLVLAPNLEKKTGGARFAGPWALMTVLAVVGTVLPGVLLRDISRVLALRGAVLGCPISFVLPGVMLLHCPQSNSWLRKKLSAWLLILFGSLAGALGFYCTFNS